MAMFIGAATGKQTSLPLRRVGELPGVKALPAALATGVSTWNG